jgi:hypothetical protein
MRCGGDSTVTSRPWRDTPGTMPWRLPPPLPELAFVIRFLLKHCGWRNFPKRDFILSALLHISVLRRLPVRRAFYNDVLFHIKTSSIITRPLARLVSDKEMVKRHIASVVGEHYVVTTLAILKTPEEIDAFAFPDRCVIKPTHASAEFLWRKNGEPLDLKRIKSWLMLDYSEVSFEANYRGLEPKIIVEPWVFDGREFKEYSFLCIEGKARIIYASSERFTDYAVVNFDTQWNELPYSSYEAGRRQFPKPEHLDDMIDVAERLAKDFFLVRIDLYYDGVTIICGEITNCPGAALCLFVPREAELIHTRLTFGAVSHESWDNFFNVE